MKPICSLCNAPQYTTPSGLTCRNGHGGAESKYTKEPIPQEQTQDSSNTLPDESSVAVGQCAYCKQKVTFPHVCTNARVSVGHSLEPVAYGNKQDFDMSCDHIDAWRYKTENYTEPLYSADTIAALTKERDEAQESASDLCRILNEELCGRTFMGEPALDAERTVKESVYLSAVKGRADFRTAFREAREQIAALTKERDAAVFAMENYRDEMKNRGETIAALNSALEIINGIRNSIIGAQPFSSASATTRELQDWTPSAK